MNKGDRREPYRSATLSTRLSLRPCIHPLHWFHFGGTIFNLHHSAAVKLDWKFLLKEITSGEDLFVVFL